MDNSASLLFLPVVTLIRACRLNLVALSNSLDSVNPDSTAVTRNTIVISNKPHCSRSLRFTFLLPADSIVKPFVFQREKNMSIAKQVVTINETSKQHDSTIDFCFLSSFRDLFCIVIGLIFCQSTVVRLRYWSVEGTLHHKTILSA